MWRPPVYLKRDGVELQEMERVRKWRDFRVQCGCGGRGDVAVKDRGAMLERKENNRERKRQERRIILLRMSPLV
jgi:hypothetical protein